MEYKHLEGRLNELATRRTNNPEISLTAHSKDYLHNDEKRTFYPQQRDLVKQLLTGFGFRVTGVRFPNGEVLCNTRTVLVTSKDPNGVQFVITSEIDTHLHTARHDKYVFFDKSNLHRFYDQHSDRQGVAVLAFHVDNVGEIEAKYKTLHPNLFFRRFYRTEILLLEVFAYYMDDDITADTGTVLRFIQPIHGQQVSVLPGLTPIDADFPEDSKAAFCDHWVSNVFSRTSFLQILEETLGFVPKVDFNAGVVAAGEAQIESTVTGNSSSFVTNDKSIALQDQSQVYLPVNNALTTVGHVYGFLKEVGQGIQHIASRVEDLASFCRRANEYRMITGEGFSFLHIPRSYYGVLTNHQLTDGGVTSETADAIFDACESRMIISSDGSVDLELSSDEIHRRLTAQLRDENLTEYTQNAQAILAMILKSRYINLHSLLMNHVSEESYLGIVRNEILVDVQGEDLLYQIFTSNILQRHAGEEAPFLELIQRVCSDSKDKDECSSKIKPGCGGFGIRNFLTLFLSIEVSKAMMEVSKSKASGDIAGQVFAQKRVECFTAQLNEANPILTDISRAMTKEGIATERMQEAIDKGDSLEKSRWNAVKEIARIDKINGNNRLMECSSKYMEAMKSIREQHLVAR